MAAPSLILELPDEAATAGLGRQLALIAREGDVILLQGDLGAGKTSLARGLIRALCGPETEVPSPTYTLVQTYAGPAFPIWHFDLYRLEDAREIRELGWEDAADGLALVEWPERLGPSLPSRRLEICLSFSAGDSGQAGEPAFGRLGCLSDHADWSARFHGNWVERSARGTEPA